MCAQTVDDHEDLHRRRIRVVAAELAAVDVVADTSPKPPPELPIAAAHGP
ncbi:hypothetical protein ACH4CE_34445 [Streptomyces gelaticus]